MTPLFPPTLRLALLVDHGPANHLADLRAHSFSEFRFSQRASGIQPEPSTVLRDVGISFHPDARS